MGFISTKWRANLWPGELKQAKTRWFISNSQKNIKVPRSSPPEELQYFQQDSEVHRGILHTKPGSILPVNGREASVVKINVFPETDYKPPRKKF